jgi:hypothetical protein
MSESKKLITKYKRLNTARQVVESISEPANTAYYVFLGNHLDYSNSTIMQPVDSIAETSIDVYRNMLYGKRVGPNDIKIMIPRNDYTANKLYEMYDDQMGESNLALFDSNYYAVVNADSFYHVFKCLDNNGGSLSTVKPEFSEIDVQDEVYQTSDGYVWKYMYSADNTTVGKFATTDFFPVVVNTAVSSSALDGLINVIKVEDAGRGYDNYCNGTFRVVDLKLDGDPKKYSLNSALTAPLTDNFFKDCYLYITSGTAMGQYSQILDYQTNSTVKAVTLLNEFAISPAADSTFEVMPGIKITGDGTQTSEAIARAIVNETGNTIQRIEMLHLGGGYKYATASVLAHNSVAVTRTANVRPIFSPTRGHGYDAAAELGGTRICISAKFSNADIGIPKTNDYRTVGLLQDPLFANVVINYNTATGTFLPTETLYSVNGVRVADNVVINTTSSIITGDADFVNQLSAGEYVYFNTTGGYQLAVVNSITNSSYMTITSNGLYSDGSASLYKTNMGSKLTSITMSPSVLTGNLVTNATSQYVYGKGTNFSTDLLANACLFIYANSTGSGEVKTITNIAYPIYTFNANSAVDNANDFITISSHALVNTDVVKYYTATGNTAVSGLSNASYYYVVSANTLGVKLSATRGGANINITKGVTESGHFLALQKLTLNSNMSYSNTDAKAQLINYSITANTIDGTQSSSGLVTTVSAGSLYVSNVAGIFKTGDFIIGSDSGATGVVTYIERSGVTKSFDTFIQMNKYIATPSAGSFVPDEVVFQSESGSFAEQYANAYLHSVVDNGVSMEYYVTNQLGVFNLANNIIGYDSDATAQVTNKYSPELVPGSGKVLFIEKVDPITRTNVAAETIKFIFEF